MALISSAFMSVSSVDYEPEATRVGERDIAGGATPCKPLMSSIALDKFVKIAIMFLYATTHHRNSQRYFKKLQKYYCESKGHKATGTGYEPKGTAGGYCEPGGF
jgi:hypothetical protein